MAWCPLCKCEYVEGVQKCADCGCELVSELEAHTDETEEVQEVSDFEVPDEQMKETAFDEEKVQSMVKGVYVNNEERAEENKTSAYTLLSVGVLGLIAVILFFAGVIDVSMSVFSKYMICGVMGVMFLLFIIMGMVSLRNFKVFKKRAVGENNLTAEIQKWMAENVDGAMVDSQLSLQDLPDEIKYFQRFDYVKNLIGQKFVNLDEAYVERLVEEMYAQLFEEQEPK